MSVGKRIKLADTEALHQLIIDMGIERQWKYQVNYVDAASKTDFTVPVKLTKDRAFGIMTDLSVNVIRITCGNGECYQLVR